MGSSVVNHVGEFLGSGPGADPRLTFLPDMDTPALLVSVWFEDAGPDLGWEGTGVEALPAFGTCSGKSAAFWKR
jgi:hypothetical protein